MCEAARPNSARRVARLLWLLAATGLSACSTMQASDAGYLTNRSEMVSAKDGSMASYRASVSIDPHQVRALSAQWGMPLDAGISAAERARLMSVLENAIRGETAALPQHAGGRPVRIHAVITRVEQVNPLLNVLTSVWFTVPLDRGGAAVEIQVLDAESLQPLASLAHAYFVPVSEFKARFSALAPAELALHAAASELARLMRDKA